MQRSVDTMVGLPSDFVLAGLMLILIANETGLEPNKVVMSLGNTHIYEEHLDKVELYLKATNYIPPTYKINTKDIYDFKPSDLEIEDYEYDKVIKFKLKE
jgi:thymidylate synthase